jgi:hypothetical protein
MPLTSKTTIKPGTRAALMDDKIPQDEITLRQDTLYEIFFSKKESNPQ